MYKRQYVNSVEKGSCAETAGLKTGDIVTQVDGKDITTSAELIDAKNTHKAGDEMTLTVYRDSDYTTLKVTLDEEQPDANDSTSDGQNDSSQDGQSGQSCLLYTSTSCPFTSKPTSRARKLS